ncbi:MAG: hypothetical protein QOG41_2526, partial [Thermoleophilaceae bacterium]|nr:hypothetical protein [Thermoleophilaceae bacterium]
MSRPELSSRPYGLPRTRAPRALATALAASLLTLVFAASAFAVEPVDMGAAHDYSVLATTLTSNGPTA